LLSQQLTTAISASIVIAENHGTRKLQPRDCFHQAQITVTQIADEQQGIRP
jgi:hypothetical protein